MTTVIETSAGHTEYLILQIRDALVQRSEFPLLKIQIIRIRSRAGPFSLAEKLDFAPQFLSPSPQAFVEFDI